MTGGFRLLSHTADLGIESWGPDLGGALAQAVRAFGVALAGEGAGRVAEERPVGLTGDDEEALLVALLQEALYLLEAEGWLTVGAALSIDDARALTGVLLGEPFDEVRHAEGHAVKAVTWHGLLVEHGAKGVRVDVFLDV